MARVGIIMGSDSDLERMSGAEKFLKEMGVPYRVDIISAHRTPEKARKYAENARNDGMEIIIAGAGMAAHLAGAMAANTHLPVIGVPLSGSPLAGQDALLSTVQMPPGMPVGTMAIDGSRNAAVFACQILALKDRELEEKLLQMRKKMVEKVEEKNRRLKEG